MDNLDDLDATELLALLREIHVPEALPEPPLWPVIISIIVITLATLIWLITFRRSGSWADHALAELRALESHPDNANQLQIAKLLKRIALTLDPRPEVKSLSGEEWLLYLNRFFNTRFFTTDEGRFCGTHLYTKPDTQHEHPALPYRQLRKLIRRRRRQS